MKDKTEILEREQRLIDKLYKLYRDMNNTATMLQKGQSLEEHRQELLAVRDLATYLAMKAEEIYSDTLPDGLLKYKRASFSSTSEPYWEMKIHD